MTQASDAPDDAPGADRRRLTLALIGLVCLVFLFEVLAPVAPGSDMLSPSLATLVAYGGVNARLVFEHGEWFRLLTSAFLHSGPMHLAFNSLALLVAGGILEPLIGRLWLAALFGLGGAAGGLASVSFNPPTLVGVGASGAIMALFGFFLAIAFRYRDRAVRRSFLVNGLGTLIPSLLPAAWPMIAGGDGLGIDYAAHAGGAAAGILLGGLFLIFWPAQAPQPGARGLAAAVVLAGVLMLGWGIVALGGQLDAARHAGQLIPDARMPQTDAVAIDRAGELIRDFPEDPRGHYYQALARIRAKDVAGAEQAVRRAVDKAEVQPGAFLADFRARLRALHALLLKELGRQKEALAVAAPACTLTTRDDILAPLRSEELCPRPKS
jgi:rhomboid protease GluP